MKKINIELLNKALYEIFYSQINGGNLKYTIYELIPRYNELRLVQIAIRRFLKDHEIVIRDDNKMAHANGELYRHVELYILATNKLYDYINSVIRYEYGDRYVLSREMDVDDLKISDDADYELYQSAFNAIYRNKDWDNISAPEFLEKYFNIKEPSAYYGDCGIIKVVSKSWTDNYKIDGHYWSVYKDGEIIDKKRFSFIDEAMEILYLHVQNCGIC